jgi:hypothetical protein
MRPFQFTGFAVLLLLGYSTAPSYAQNGPPPDVSNRRDNNSIIRGDNNSVIVIRPVDQLPNSRNSPPPDSRCSILTPEQRRNTPGCSSNGVNERSK